MRDIQLILKGPNGVGKIRELTQCRVESVLWELNGDGGAEITSSPLTDDAIAIQVNRTEIEIWINGVLEHSVVPITCKGPLELATFGCSGVLSYLHGSYITGTDLNQDGIDQLTIGWNLITRAQSQTDRNIDSAFFDTSGVNRTILYPKDEMPNIHDKLVELTTLDNGFDFDIVLFGDGRREWTPYYPFKGEYKPQYALELDRHGRKYIKSLQYSEDGTIQANDVYVSGATVENNSVDPPTRVKMTGHNENVSSTSIYGKIQKVISNTQQGNQAYLNAQAKEYANQFRLPVKLPILRVDGSLFGLVKTGDIVPVRVDYGRYLINGDFRLTSIKLSSQFDDLDLTIQPVLS